jgi:hypothetical protein
MAWICSGDCDKLIEGVLDSSMITYLAEMAEIPFQTANCLSEGPSVASNERQPSLIRLCTVLLSASVKDAQRYNFVHYGQGSA